MTLFGRSRGSRVVSQAAQPLVESMERRTLLSASLVGGGIGLALGFGLAEGLSRWQGWPAKVPPNAVAMAFGFAAATGVFFGFYPARKAARLDPIDALRFE